MSDEPLPPDEEPKTEPAAQPESDAQPEQTKSKQSKAAKATKLARNVGLSMAALLAVLIIGGVAYTYYGGPANTATPTNEEEQSEQYKPLAKPREPAPDANVGVSVQAITTPVAPGSNASITVRTLQDAVCEIAVTYDENDDEIEVEDSGLTPKQADEYGMVSWAWTVGALVPEGEQKATVECVRNEKSGVVVGEVVVKQPQ